jgi:hypothetical protein
VVAVLMMAPLAAADSFPAGGCSTTLRPGNRVRLTAPGVVAKRLEASVVSSDATVLKVFHDGMRTSIPRSSITRLERSVRPSRRDLGLKIGAAVGFVIGAGVGVALLASDAPANGSCDQCGFAVALLGMAGALPAAAIGAAVAPGERWMREDPRSMCVDQRANVPDERPKARVRVAIAPARGGIGLKLAVAF